MNFAAGVDATKPAAPYSYQWIYNGKVIESGSARLPAGGRDYVHSKDLVEPQDGRIDHLSDHLAGLPRQVPQLHHVLDLSLAHRVPTSSTPGGVPCVALTWVKASRC